MFRKFINIFGILSQKVYRAQISILMQRLHSFFYLESNEKVNMVPLPGALRTLIVF
jgi:hypothetical protein